MYQAQSDQNLYKVKFDFLCWNDLTRYYHEQGNEKKSSKKFENASLKISSTLFVGLR